jgi:hypothetical protein
VSYELTQESFLSITHALRALGYMGAMLEESGCLTDKFVQPMLVDAWVTALEKTAESYDRSPIDRRHFQFI